jgi:NOL1/NOP2/sun family putative RNA methylase
MQDVLDSSEKVSVFGSPRNSTFDIQNSTFLGSALSRTPVSLDRRIHAIFDRYASIIPDYAAFLDSLRAPVPTHLRVNTLKTSAARLRERLDAQGVKVEVEPANPLVFRVENLPNPGVLLEYQLGLYHVQGLSSTFPPLVLDPQPGESVLDLCASPGSKTTQLAAQMEGRGLLIGNDIDVERVKILKRNIDRLGAINVTTTIYRGEKFPDDVPFDRILVDAPCSGLGTYRVGWPEPYGREVRTVRRLAVQQEKLLLRAFDLLRPGGVLVYSTCTFAPEENEAVVDGLLRQRPAAKVLPISLAGPHVPGVVEWQGRSFHPSLVESVRLYPHLLNSWGFYIARITKT